jgi:hypothetical protein
MNIPEIKKISSKYTRYFKLQTIYNFDDNF